MADQNTARSERLLKWLQDAYAMEQEAETFGFENTEIATYRALVIAAERAGAPDIAAVCGQILQEEVAMARWLEDHQDGLVGAFLNRDETPGAQAKR